LIVVLVLAAMTAPLASGHPSPPGCTQAAFTFAWGPGLHSVHRNGDVVPITAEVGNDNIIGGGICDVTDATVTLQFPNTDGTAGGRLFTLATNVDFAAGSAPKSFPTKKLMLGFDPGVFRGPVTIAVTGVWHVSEPDPDPLTSSSSTPAVVSWPHATFTVMPAITIAPPFTVTYTYSAEKDSPDDPGIPVNPTPDEFSVKVSDNNCAPVTFTGGDTTPTMPLLWKRVRRGPTAASARCRPAPSSTSPPSRPRVPGTVDHGRSERFAWRGADVSSPRSSGR
jgi:hypothetical protein